jgi:predicted nucleic acid-binding protein
MKIVDANIILRYLLNDHDELSAKATTIIEDNDVLLPNEVVAGSCLNQGDGSSGPVG